MARKMAAELDYVPLPEALIEQVRATWKSDIKGVTAWRPLKFESEPASLAIERRLRK